MLHSSLDLTHKCQENIFTKLCPLNVLIEENMGHSKNSYIFITLDRELNQRWHVVHLLYKVRYILDPHLLKGQMFSESSKEEITGRERCNWKCWNIDAHAHTHINIYATVTLILSVTEDYYFKPETFSFSSDSGRALGSFLFSQ